MVVKALVLMLRIMANIRGNIIILFLTTFLFGANSFDTSIFDNIETEKTTDGKYVLKISTLNVQYR